MIVDGATKRAKLLGTLLGSVKACLWSDSPEIDPVIGTYISTSAARCARLEEPCVSMVKSLSPQFKSVQYGKTAPASDAPAGTVPTSCLVLEHVGVSVAGIGADDDHGEQCVETGSENPPTHLWHLCVGARPVGVS